MKQANQMNTLKAKIASAIWEVETGRRPDWGQLFKSQHGLACLLKAEAAIRMIKEDEDVK